MLGEVSFLVRAIGEGFCEEVTFILSLGDGEPTMSPREAYFKYRVQHVQRP